MKLPLDPVQILNDLAASCTRAEDGVFWILTSAAFRLEGGEDDEGSTAACYYWSRLRGAQ